MTESQGLRVLVVWVAAVTCTVPAAAQTPNSIGRHAFGLEAGRVLHGVDDELASPVRYQGDAAVIGAWYRYRGTAWRLGVSLAQAGPRLSPAAGGRSSHEDVTAVSVDGWALRQLWRSGGGRWTAFVGPGLAADVGLRTHYYRLDRSATYDNAFIGLQATGLIEWEVPGLGLVSERVMLPVVGVAVRTDYTGLAGPGPDVSVGLPPSFVLLRHRFDIRAPVSERVVFGFLFEGTLVHHAEPLELGVAWRRIGVSVALAWGRP